MSQYRYVDFFSPATSENLNTHLVDGIRHGLHTGFKISDSTATGYIFISPGTMHTREGVRIVETARAEIEEEQAPPVNHPRIRVDRVVLKYSYDKQYPAVAAGYKIKYGEELTQQQLMQGNLFTGDKVPGEEIDEYTLAYRILTNFDGTNIESMVMHTGRDQENVPPIVTLGDGGRLPGEYTQFFGWEEILDKYRDTGAQVLVLGEHMTLQSLKLPSNFRLLGFGSFSSILCVADDTTITTEGFQSVGQFFLDETGVCMTDNSSQVNFDEVSLRAKIRIRGISHDLNPIAFYDAVIQERIHGSGPGCQTIRIGDVNPNDLGLNDQNPSQQLEYHVLAVGCSVENLSVAPPISSPNSQPGFHSCINADFTENFSVVNVTGHNAEPTDYFVIATEYCRGAKVKNCFCDGPFFNQIEFRNLLGGEIVDNIINGDGGLFDKNIKLGEGCRDVVVDRNFMAGTLLDQISVDIHPQAFHCGNRSWPFCVEHESNGTHPEYARTRGVYEGILSVEPNVLELLDSTDYVLNSDLHVSPLSPTPPPFAFARHQSSLGFLCRSFTINDNAQLTIENGNGPFVIRARDDVTIDGTLEVYHTSDAGRNAPAMSIIKEAQLGVLKYDLGDSSFHTIGGGGGASPVGSGGNAGLNTLLTNHGDGAKTYITPLLEDPIDFSSWDLLRKTMLEMIYPMNPAVARAGGSVGKGGPVNVVDSYAGGNVVIYCGGTININGRIVVSGQNGGIFEQEDFFGGGGGGAGSVLLAGKTVNVNGKIFAKGGRGGSTISPPINVLKMGGGGGGAGGLVVIVSMNTPDVSGTFDVSPGDGGAGWQRTSGNNYENAFPGDAGEEGVALISDVVPNAYLIGNAFCLCRGL